MPSEYTAFPGRDKVDGIQPCPYLLAQGHRIDPVPTHLLPTLAEMGLEDHDSSLYTWILRLDHGSQSQMPAVPPKVAACAAATNQVHSLTQHPHHDKLRQRSDGCLRRSCDMSPST